jgi:hypothetical protein
MKDTKTPRWLLERLALGELDAEAAAEVRRRAAAAGEDLDAALAEIAASNAQLLAEHPPARMAQAIRRRAEASRPPRRARLWMAAPVLLAGAMALAVWVRPTGDHPGGGDGPETTRVKGPAPSRLVVYRHERGGDRPLADGAAAAEGDLVQLAYRERHAGFGLLLSIDGGGTVTLHWPDGKSTGAAPLETAGEARLPSAYQLDDAPGFERFFLVTAPRPFPVAAVVDAARALAARPREARTAPLPLPPTFEQTSLVLDKAGARKDLR